MASCSVALENIDVSDDTSWQLARFGDAQIEINKQDIKPSNFRLKSLNVYVKKLVSATHVGDVITLFYNDKTTQQYEKGKYGGWDECTIEISRQLDEICSYISYHGNPFPTGHLYNIKQINNGI